MTPDYSMIPVRSIDSPEAMIAAIRYFGILPFFRCGIPGWSVEELTAPGCWFSEDEASFLGPWDWKIDAVREGDIAYGKFLGGKAAFATVTWYRELMNWRRSQPRWRMALGERYKATTQSDKLMKILAPLALDAIRTAGGLEMKELRTICAQRIASAQLKTISAHYRPMLAPTVKKNVMDSVIQFLQMGTWTVIGDFERVYRGPELTYRGWQRASNTTPDELFAVPILPTTQHPPVSDPSVPDPSVPDPSVSGLSVSDLPASGLSASGSTAPASFSSSTAPRSYPGLSAPHPLSGSSAPNTLVGQDCLAIKSTPEVSREKIIAHIREFFPLAEQKVLERLI